MLDIMKTRAKSVSESNPFTLGVMKSATSLQVGDLTLKYDTDIDETDFVVCQTWMSAGKAPPVSNDLSITYMTSATDSGTLKIPALKKEIWFSSAG